MGDRHRRRGGRGCDRLSLRRLQDNSDTFYDNPVCPCESEEAEPQSEYETSGEWVTYTGEVDVRIFDEAARYAEADVAQKQMDAADVMLAEAQKLYGLSAEAAPSAPVLDEDESPPVDIQDAAEVDKENTQGAAAESSEEELPVDPIKDEWSAFMAAERAEKAANAAKSALRAAEEAQRNAKAAREANLPNASQLADMAYSATQLSFEAAEFAKRAADAAKQAAESAKLAETQLALAKLTTTSAKIQVFEPKPILKEKKSE